MGLCNMKYIKKQLTTGWGNNLLPLQTINSDQGEETLTGVTITSILLSSPMNNSTCMNFNHKLARVNATSTVNKAAS